jgi:hypothetical protein
MESNAQTPRRRVLATCLLILGVVALALSIILPAAGRSPGWLATASSISLWTLLALLFVWEKKDTGPEQQPPR